MDAFKQNEILRMQYGGNRAWQDFYNANNGNENGGKAFEDASREEKEKIYESDVGDEWKERLSAKVEGKDFDIAAWKKVREAYNAKCAASASSRQSQPAVGNARKGAASPATGGGQTQKEKTEAFLSQLGAINATRPDNIPPSQGGRHTGFGNTSSTDFSPSENGKTASLPSTAEIQTDPVAALTKGFGWFTTSLSRTAKTVNDAYIQPTAKNIASSDLAAQARAAALQAGTGIQTSAKTATESFNRFVEGQDQNQRPPQNHQTPNTTTVNIAGSNVHPDKRDFWDSFGDSSFTGASISASAASAADGTTRPNPKSPSSTTSTATTTTTTTTTTSLGTAAVKNNSTGPSQASRNLKADYSNSSGSGTADDENAWKDW
jgi:ADP-ribosylation factor GTPase-activating protein 1